jgi:hypothetical protein
LRQQYFAILSRLTPLSAVGMSVALGAAAPAAASEPPAAAEPSVTGNERVSERLAAIRDAVSIIAEDEAVAAKSAGRLAWGNWGGGWGWPNWRNWPNWHNWGNYFRNW